MAGEGRPPQHQEEADCFSQEAATKAVRRKSYSGMGVVALDVPAGHARDGAAVLRRYNRLDIGYELDI